MTTPNNGTYQRTTTQIGRTFGALFIGICLVAIILTVAFPARTSAASVLNISAVADTFVEGGSPSKNFGTEQKLEIKDASNIDNDRIAFLRFDLRNVTETSLGSAFLQVYVTHLPNGSPAPFKLHAVADDTWAEKSLTWQNKPALGAQLHTQSIAATGWVSIDVTQFVKAELAGDKQVSLAFQDDSLARLMIRLGSRESKTPPVLVLNGASGQAPATTVPTSTVAPSATAAPTKTTPPTATTAPTKTPVPTATAKPSVPTATTAPTKTPVPTATAPVTPPSGPVKGIWISPAEIAQLPMSGAAWQKVKAAADGNLGTPNISDQDSNHDVNTLAVALVYARTGNSTYRAKAANAILSVIGTEAGGRTLALGRNLLGYVIAADLIDLKSYDPAGDQRFRAWLTNVRKANLDGMTLIQTHEQRPNNWGTHAGASRIAVALYLGDTADLNRAATVFKGWLGDRNAYAGFKYGDLSWQADASKPVGVNPAGATKNGHSIDGALPDDMRRGCSFSWPPCKTGYAWEAMQGAVVQAHLLSRAGYDAWGWQDRAMLRATQFLYNLDKEVGGWWASSDDQWQPWIINRAYGTNFPAASPAGTGKNMGWTDWTLGR